MKISSFVLIALPRIGVKSGAFRHTNHHHLIFFSLAVPAAVRLRTQQVPAPSHSWMPRRQVPFTAKKSRQSSVQHRKCAAQKRCLQQHLEQATDINTSFQRRNQCDQTQFLLDMFHVPTGGSIHLVNGEKVCRNAVNGISWRR